MTDDFKIAQAKNIVPFYSWKQHGKKSKANAFMPASGAMTE